MKALKKFLAVLSAGTMIMGGAAVSGMTASADASLLGVESIIALRQWTDYMESQGIPFTEMGINSKAVFELYDALKEKGISAADLCIKFDKDQKEMANLLRQEGLDEKEIDLNFCMLMLGAQGNYRSSSSYCRPGKSEKWDAECRRLEQLGYTWNGERWDFDVDAYLIANGRLDKPTDVLENEKVEGDINGDGVFNVSDVVMLQKALSTSTATLDMDINGDGKVNVFDIVAVKRMLSDSLGRAKSV